ncbi:MAG: iron-containing alcohol dehydrogenase family protein [Erysipelotrichia bacterium]|nr:iron-containing alcohol dehydrogenase family protein [Erysipelotrichia bacterium]
MFFKIPTTVYFEKDCVLHSQKEIQALGKKALIVCGQHSAYSNGSFDDVITVLQDQNIAYELFDRIEENPSMQTVEEAYKLNKDKNIDFIIAVGGGSAMDAAKAIGVMLYYGLDEAAKLYDQPLGHCSLPIVAIPTTCGTGSEVTAAAVLTNNIIKSKASITYRIYPKIALLDGKYLRTLSVKNIKNTAVDALGHLIESYISSKATKFSDMLTSEGLRVWGLNKEILKDPANLLPQDYENLLLASVYGGMAIAHCGTNIPHGLSYPLTYYENIPHGKAVGFFLYGLLKYADRQRVKEVLDLLGFNNLEELKTYLSVIFSLEKPADYILDKAVEELAQNKNKLSYAPYNANKDLLRKIAYSLWTE